MIYRIKNGIIIRIFESEEGIDYDDLMVEIETFMKNNIGENYRDYIIFGEMAPDIANINEAYRGLFVYHDIWAKYVRLPWGSWCWSGAGVKDLSGSFLWTNNHSGQTIWSDEVTSAKTYTFSSGTYNYLKVEVTGNTKWGFFPRVESTKGNYSLQGPAIEAIDSNYGFDYGVKVGDYWYTGWITWIMP